jgi:hypothetical protein
MLHGRCDRCANHVSVLHERKPSLESVGPRTSFVQQIGTITSWIFTWGIVLLIPKCPACLAAYVACGTGIGLSVSTAGYVRLGLLAACAATLAFLTQRLVRQRVVTWRARERPFRGEPRV